MSLGQRDAEERHRDQGESCHASPKAFGYGIGAGKYTRPWDKQEYRVAFDAIAEAGFKHVGLMTTKSKTRLVISMSTELDEARKIGEEAKKRGLKRNDIAVIASRRGEAKAVVETEGRNRPPKGYTFVPFFDEAVFINKVTLDATCPMSKETDYKKCAVKVYKA